jgi:hypothetical protein
VFLSARSMPHNSEALDSVLRKEVDHAVTRDAAARFKAGGICNTAKEYSIDDVGGTQVNYKAIQGLPNTDYHVSVSN